MNGCTSILGDSAKARLRCAIAALMVMAIVGMWADAELDLCRAQPAERLSSDPDVNRLMNAILDADVPRVRQILRSSQPKLNEFDEWGATPLLRAITGSQRPGGDEIVSLLIAHGADVNQADERGCIPFMYTLAWWDPRVADELLRAGADPNARIGGKTLLHMAVCAEDGGDRVRMLLAGGADATARDALGATPLDYALEEGEHDMARLLRSHLDEQGRRAAPAGLPTISFCGARR